jgi:hypothetical protein
VSTCKIILEINLLAPEKEKRVELETLIPGDQSVEKVVQDVEVKPRHETASPTCLDVQLQNGRNSSAYVPQCSADGIFFLPVSKITLCIP